MGATGIFLQSTVDAASQSAYRVFVVAVGLVVVTVWARSTFFGEVSRFPSVNYKQSEWTYLQAKKRFITDARRLIAQGFKKFSGPFSLVTDLGPLIMLSPDMIDAVNQAPALCFKQFCREEFLAEFDTFRTFRPPPEGLFEDAVIKGLTRSLPKFTKPLSDRMASCLDKSWGDSTDWHEIKFREDILDWVARLSTHIFIGKRLSENEEWLRISIDFTVDCFIGQAICKLFPRSLRWIADKILPLNRKVRRHYRNAARLLSPILEERHAEIAAAQREGRKPILPDDSIEWFRNASKGRTYNEIDIQLGLAVAAVHSTSDLLSQALLNLCAHPECFAPLRAEIVAVLQKFGWKKVALTELRLLDSLFKETQRLKPLNMASMHRTATADVELSNGLVIKKGERTAISSHRMWSSEHYENPEQFQAFRFAERRKISGLENRSQLVATSPDHTAFSHGKHACPGRFFAANEVKIAMVHIILKYDIKIEDATQAKWAEYGTNMFTNRKAKVRVRRRQAEIDIDAVPAVI